MWMRKFRRRMWSFRGGVGPPTSPRPNGRSYQGGMMGALDGRIKEEEGRCINAEVVIDYFMYYNLCV